MASSGSSGMWHSMKRFMSPEPAKPTPPARRSLRRSLSRRFSGTFSGGPSWWSEALAGEQERQVPQDEVDGFADFFDYDNADERFEDQSEDEFNAESTSDLPVYDLREEGHDEGFVERAALLADNLVDGAGRLADRAGSFSDNVVDGAGRLAGSIATWAFSLGRRNSDCKSDARPDHPEVVGEDGWTIFPECDVKGLAASKAEKVTDLEECKRLCIQKGYGGLIFQDGCVRFQKVSRADLLDSRNHRAVQVGEKRISLPTLLVAPDLEEARVKEQWIAALEKNLMLLRIKAEEIRYVRKDALAKGETAAAEAASKNLDHTKYEVSRLAEALWHALGDHKATSDTANIQTTSNAESESVSLDTQVASIPRSEDQRISKSVAGDLVQAESHKSSKSIPRDELAVSPQGRIESTCKAHAIAQAEETKPTESPSPHSLTGPLQGDVESKSQAHFHEQSQPSKPTESASLQAPAGAAQGDLESKSKTALLNLLNQMQNDLKIADGRLKAAASEKQKSGDEKQKSGDEKELPQPLPPAASLSTKGEEEQVRAAGCAVQEELSNLFKGKGAVLPSRGGKGGTGPAAPPPPTAAAEESAAGSVKGKGPTAGAEESAASSVKGKGPTAKAEESAAGSVKGKTGASLQEESKAGSVKGKKGIPLPPGKGAGKAPRMKSPIKRNFHWQGISKDRLRGTVFDLEASPAASQGPSLDLAALQALFEAGEGAEEDAPNQEARSPAKRTDGPEIRVFTQSRAQHVAIVFRRVFGAPSVADMENFAVGLSSLNLPLGHAVTMRRLDAEDLELMATALPTDDESARLQAAPVERLRQIERLALPLSSVKHADKKLRALRLKVQAESMQSLPMARIGKLIQASQALRNSTTLRQLLLTVARLGSWINSADQDTHRGFALSSALGKLHQFRATRGDRGLSLLHVVALSTAGGDPAEVGALSARLATELQALPEAARQDILELGQSVANFREQAKWLAAEAEQPDSQEIQAQLQAIHQEEFAERVGQLEKAMETARGELKSTLTFFAERWDPTDQAGFEPAAEHLLRTVEEFRCSLQNASQQILEKPARFKKIYEKVPNVGQSDVAGVQQPGASQTAQDETAPSPNTAPAPSASSSELVGGNRRGPRVAASRERGSRKVASTLGQGPKARSSARALPVDALGPSSSDAAARLTTGEPPRTLASLSEQPDAGSGTCSRE